MNILKLVESTQNELKNKQFHYKQLEKYAKFADDEKTKQFIQNFINGDKSRTLKFDNRYLGEARAFAGVIWQSSIRCWSRRRTCTKLRTRRT